MSPVTMNLTRQRARMHAMSCAVAALLACGTTAAGQVAPLVAIAKRDSGLAPVRAALKRGGDVNAQGPDGATALLWATQWDNWEVAQALVTTGADVNIANQAGMTPLFMACTNGSGRMVDLLLKAGANANVRLPSGETALMRAARVGRTEALLPLLDRKADVNAVEPLSGQTALMWAATEGHLAATRLLLRHGADVNARSTGGFTPLMFAARYGAIDVIPALLEAGAKIEDGMRDGTTALHIAAVRGSVEVVRLLLNRGADPNASGPGYTPLHWAASSPESALVRDFPEWAIEQGYLTPARKREMLTALLDKGATPNVTLTKDLPSFGSGGVISSARRGSRFAGATPFLLAAMTADVETMRLLLERGADPQLATTNGTTPLMVVAGVASDEESTVVPVARRVEAAKLCLDLGNAVTAANQRKVTALHGAATLGFDPVVELLVQRGADINARDANGDTPLKIADGFQSAGGMTVYFHPKTAALLRKLGAKETVGSAPATSIVSPEVRR